eukprot:TRINITY_DN14687_c0_g1_i1.p1 TRINITY_DN14687_c0_g1~~TRINITY_DN14687_c0_g1_i1.p1  ORF type:complete len:119 (-),score=8.52 TRINITY_DN14687_c0_g1_i1:10-366(-)
MSISSLQSNVDFWVYTSLLKMVSLRIDKKSTATTANSNRTNFSEFQTVFGRMNYCRPLQSIRAKIFRDFAGEEALVAGRREFLLITFPVKYGIRTNWFTRPESTLSNNYWQGISYFWW